MKTLTTNLMIATAALAAVAGSASAQSLKAEIPFTFRAGNAVMAPGEYRVNVSSTAGRSLVTLYNLDNRKSAMIVNFTVDKASPREIASGASKLAFDCAGRDCVLRNLWRDGDGVAYRFLGPKPHGDDVHTAQIALTPAKAD